MTAATEPPLTRVKIVDLKVHPRQLPIFGEATESEVATLVSEMTTHSRTPPIEVLPDGTIITGYRLVVAARQLNWSELDARVRLDLVGKHVLIELRLVEDNLQRRQLTPLEIGRWLKQLIQLAKRHDRARPFKAMKEDLWQRVAKIFGISRARLDRLHRLGCMPLDIQQAVEVGRLTSPLAEKVACLSKNAWHDLAVDIQFAHSAQAAQAVAQKHLADIPEARDINAAFGRFMEAMRRGRLQLSERLQEIGVIGFDDERELKRTIKLAERLLQKVKARSSDDDDDGWSMWAEDEGTDW